VNNRRAKDKLRENQRKAKERKRLASPRSELDEELRWKYDKLNYFPNTGLLPSANQ
jgi:hypothetical protein